ncbi:aliphatic sulfonate ABC transporter substrate-binding protein [Caenibius tardaugens NBRC 16725]|uniref:Aliphatic sulfonate ABC transporter substrate-binding protein n=1 Tax=Caenibius tardaugens NBRC 16725 TaxID=1219035 RepID=U3A853_9SPHN|nr:ABC transporter substrate-binding protein [Caenibius tardaugens]AZI37927.1 ABC transporter substrate-binding protein [Caenibius tardaugens NBRC 16725]GAD50938.1 aliphatic sulfonate ABC transporter substrate-binding protein [Caenibius tardaugens NBRC 16725]
MTAQQILNAETATRAHPLKPPFHWLRAIAAGALLTLTGCGNTPDAQGGKPVLNVGDQLEFFRTTLESANQAKPDDYTIKWANFVGGPAIIAAQTGGSIDVGWMAETPLIFAQAAGSPVKVVGVSKAASSDGYGYALVVKADSPIRSVKDLKGRSVAYMRGTVLHYMIARVLEREGLSLKDIKSIQATSFGSGLLDQGAADAITLAEPHLTRLLEEGKVRVIATGAAPVTEGLNYLVASDAALADPKKAKAIGDLVTRATRSYLWQNAHAAEAAPYLAKVYKIDPKLAQTVIERSPSVFVPIDETVIAAHQSEANLFQKIGLVRVRLDAGKIFDPRFNALVAQVEPNP